MRVREARLEDAAAIARVHVAAWQTAYRGIVPDAYLDSLDPARRELRWREMLSQRADRECHYVAETLDGELVGFAAGGPARTEIALPDRTEHFDGELYAIYLLAEQRRRGAGRLLTRAVAQRLLERGMASMLVWVLAANPSRAFYERLGGVLVGEQPIMIADTELIEVAYGWPDVGVLTKGS
jgi:L-amino acid N-acyltransferase YncA